MIWLLSQFLVARLHKLSGAHDGELADCRGRKVTAVARHQRALERLRAFGEWRIVDIRKAADKMRRQDHGVFRLGLNPLQHKRHFMTRKAKFRTSQNLFVFRDNPVIQPCTYRTASEPLDDPPGSPMRTEKPRHHDIGVEDRDARAVAHERCPRAWRAAVITPSIS